MQVHLHRTFLKDFKKLDSTIRNRFVERKAMFGKDSRNPLLNDHALGGEYVGRRSINITGDYRAIYEIGLHDTIECVSIEEVNKHGY